MEASVPILIAAINGITTGADTTGRSLLVIHVELLGITITTATTTTIITEVDQAQRAVTKLLPIMILDGKNFGAK